MRIKCDLLFIIFLYLNCYEDSFCASNDIDSFFSFRSLYTHTHTIDKNSRIVFHAFVLYYSSPSFFLYLNS